MITSQFDASTLRGSNDCSTTGLDITEKLSNGRSGFHEDLVKLRLRSFPVGPFLPSAKAAQIRICKKNLEIEQRTDVAAVHFASGKLLAKEQSQVTQWFGSDEPNA